MGRKSTFTQEIADEILRRLSSGEPLAQICRDEEMPSVSSVYRWIEAVEEFAEGFARARAEGFDQIALDCLKIADEQEAGEIITDTPDGKTIKTEDMLGHRKLRIETRLKLLAKWDPKRYGEKLELAGSKESPLTVEIVRLATETTK